MTLYIFVIFQFLICLDCQAVELQLPFQYLKKPVNEKTFLSEDKVLQGSIRFQKNPDSQWLVRGDLSATKQLDFSSIFVIDGSDSFKRYREKIDLEVFKASIDRYYLTSSVHKKLEGNKSGSDFSKLLETVHNLVSLGQGKLGLDIYFVWDGEVSSGELDPIVLEQMILGLTQYGVRFHSIVPKASLKSYWVTQLRDLTGGKVMLIDNWKVDSVRRRPIDRVLCQLGELPVQVVFGKEKSIGPRQLDFSAKMKCYDPSSRVWEEFR